MLDPQIMAAIKQMPNLERVEMIEFALQLVREEMAKPEKLSLKDAAEIMQPYYTEGSSLTEFVDSADEDFYEYHNYA